MMINHSKNPGKRKMLENLRRMVERAAVPAGFPWHQSVPAVIAAAVFCARVAGNEGLRLAAYSVLVACVKHAGTHLVLGDQPTLLSDQKQAEFAKVLEEVSEAWRLCLRGVNFWK